VKKFLIVGALALGLVFVGQQRASAWIKFNVGFGFNWTFESGNNCWLWGLFRNGQLPGSPTDACCGQGCGFGGFGHGFGGYDMGYGGYYGDVHTGSHAPAQQNPQGEQKNGDSGKTTSAYYPGYQPVGYSYPAQGYYPSSGYSSPGYYPSYGYSGYGYGAYQAPSYWYGSGYGY
jgi:hypothetical protein